MENLKMYSDEFTQMIKFSRKMNGKVAVSETLLGFFSEALHTSGNTVKDKLRVVTSPFVLVAGTIAYQVERTRSKNKLASIMECSKEQIACSEGDFADKNGNSKTIIGCSGDLCTKNVQKESLTTLSVITGDLHMESLDEEHCAQLNSLEFVGGDLCLSDKNIEALEQGRILTNLKHVDGKVLVNSMEYKSNKR